MPCSVIIASYLQTIAVKRNTFVFLFYNINYEVPCTKYLGVVYIVRILCSNT